MSFSKLQLGIYVPSGFTGQAHATWAHVLQEGTPREDRA